MSCDWNYFADQEDGQSPEVYARRVLGSLSEFVASLGRRASRASFAPPPTVWARADHPRVALMPAQSQTIYLGLSP